MPNFDRIGLSGPPINKAAHDAALKAVKKKRKKEFSLISAEPGGIQVLKIKKK